METIVGIEIFPIISFLIFFIFFIVLFIWVARMHKSEVTELANLPFEEEDKQKQAVNQ
jgi:cbb3-type cytochrome oxidase subunit 3